jgi:hypothetical protein
MNITGASGSVNLSVFAWIADFDLEIARVTFDVFIAFYGPYLEVSRCKTDPQIVALGLENHGHSVVNRGGQGVGCRGSSDVGSAEMVAVDPSLAIDGKSISSSAAGLKATPYSPRTFELSTAPERLRFMPFYRGQDEEYTTYLRRT